MENEVREKELAALDQEEKEASALRSQELKDLNAEVKRRKDKIHAKHRNTMTDIRRRRNDTNQRFPYDIDDDTTSTDSPNIGSSQRPPKRPQSSQDLAEQPQKKHKVTEDVNIPESNKVATPHSVGFPGQPLRWYLRPENETTSKSPVDMFIRGLGVTSNEFQQLHSIMERMAKAGALSLPQVPKFPDFSLWFEEILKRVAARATLGLIPDQSWVKKALQNMLFKAITEGAFKSKHKYGAARVLGLWKYRCERREGNKTTVHAWEKNNYGPTTGLRFEGAFWFVDVNNKVVAKSWAMRPSVNSVLRVAAFDGHSDRVKFEGEDGLHVWLWFNTPGERNVFVRMCQAGWPENPPVSQ